MARPSSPPHHHLLELSWCRDSSGSAGDTSSSCWMKENSLRGSSELNNHSAKIVREEISALGVKMNWWKESWGKRITGHLFSIQFFELFNSEPKPHNRMYSTRIFTGEWQYPHKLYWEIVLKIILKFSSVLLQSTPSRQTNQECK